MSGAQKRASLEKHLQAFKKCVKEMVNNAMEQFKPGALKIAMLRNLGITTREATISSNVNISEQAKIEVATNILKMQTNYWKKNVEILSMVKIDNPI